MELLNNKKALVGIIIGVVVVLLVGFFLLPMISGGGDSGDGSPAATPASPGGPKTPGAGPATPGLTPRGLPPGAPPVPGGGPFGPGAGATGASAPGTTGGKPDKAQPPTDAHRPDPFSPLIPRVKPSPEQLLAQEARQELATLPPLSIYQPDSSTLGGAGGVTTFSPTAALDQPDTSQRRVAGIVMGRNVSAILEVDGQTAVVKPGDVLPDFSRVERIERDRVLLRKGTRAIVVPLSNNPNGPTGGGPVAGPAGPGAGPYGPGRRSPGIPPPGTFRRSGG